MIKYNPTFRINLEEAISEFKIIKKSELKTDKVKEEIEICMIKDLENVKYANKIKKLSLRIRYIYFNIIKKPI
jgi:hypothetical protein